MDIFASMFLAAALQAWPTCLVASTQSGHAQSGHAQSGQAQSGQAQHIGADFLQRFQTDKTKVEADGTQLRNLAGPETYGDSEDLLFYSSVHAQAVGDLSGTPLTPWLELRSLADQTPHQRQSMQGPSRSVRSGNNICVGSAAGTFASALTLPLLHERDLVAPDRFGR